MLTCKSCEVEKGGSMETAAPNPLLHTSTTMSHRDLVWALQHIQLLLRRKLATTCWATNSTSHPPSLDKPKGCRCVCLFWFVLFLSLGAIFLAICCNLELRSLICMLFAQEPLVAKNQQPTKVKNQVKPTAKGQKLKAKSQKHKAKSQVSQVSQASQKLTKAKSQKQTGHANERF